jgi:hypothetical protein
MKVLIAIVLISLFVGFICCLPAEYNQQPTSQPTQQSDPSKVGDVFRAAGGFFDSVASFPKPW